MKASPTPISSYQQTPSASRRAIEAPPRFGGLGDAASSLVGVIDSNRMMELMASDGIGMILPRTALAFHCRGSDDGRETFLREVSGLIGNIFLAGWAGYGMTRMLGDSVNAYNPKGIPGRAWITSQNLDAFGKIYLDQLKTASSAEEARTNFIHKVLGGLESGDRAFSIESRLSCLEQLDQASQASMLDKMIKSVPEKGKLNLDQCKASLKKLIGLRDQLQDPARKTIYTEERTKLRRQFFDAGWGKLSKDAKTELANAFAQKPLEKADSKVRGTLPLDAMAHQRVSEKQDDFIKSHRLESLKTDPQKLESALKHNGFDHHKEFLKQRLALSLNDLKYNAKDFQKKVDQDALSSNLTSTVQLHHRLDAGIGQELHLTSNRGVLLKEMKHFLEQFADRAAHEAQTELPQTWNGEVKKRIEDKLMATSHSDNPLRKLIPQADDGLITAAIKSRAAYTWTPMAFCIAAAGAFTFYNNYLTMKKHSGKVFFPGEGLPPIEGAPKYPLQTGTQTNLTGANGLYHNFGRFPNYPQFRNSQGGIIA